MAGPRTCRNVILPAGKNEFAERAFTKSSDTFFPTSATFRAFILVYAPVSGPLSRYIDENLQRATKLALELFVQG